MGTSKSNSLRRLKAGNTKWRQRGEELKRGHASQVREWQDEEWRQLSARIERGDSIRATAF